MEVVAAGLEVVAAAAAEEGQVAAGFEAVLAVTALGGQGELLKQVEFYSYS